MADKTITTKDHEAIRSWAESRNGHPAAVKATEKGDDAGILRIEFSGRRAEGLEDISWDEFFDKFDQQGLSFLYRDKTATGRTSRFCKFVRAERGEAGQRSSRQHASKSRS